MYASFYKLEKEPFHITPDPEFLFLSPSHKEALGSIIYGVGHRKGFVLITGEVGVGKTTIVRSYLDQVDRSKLKIIYIFNSNVSFQGLLKTIYRELGVVELTDDVFELVNQLHYLLIEEYRKGFTVVLIIDEAQNMPVETLENIRLLSNLETSKDKLLQIVFSGQPEFERKLERPELRQLRQRIAVKATIRPLTPEESRAYILHRLARASAKNPALFTEGALRAIIRESRGVPRSINILCENSFMTALGYREGRVTSRIAREVISDFSGKKTGGLLKTALTCLALIAAILGAFLMLAGRQPAAPPAATGRTPTAAPSGKTDEIAPPPVRPQQAAPAAPADAGGTAGNPEPAASAPTFRVVKRGDTLSRLVKDVYGYSNRELLNFVKNNNSFIYDMDIINVGEKIVFPVREKGGDS